MKKIYTQMVALARSWVFVPLLFAGAANAQVLIPYSGSSTISCGTNTTIADHAGSGNYSNYAYGYVVLDGGFNSVNAINGTYDIENSWDYLFLYDGAGTGGTLLGSWTGFGTFGYTTTPGQTVTLEFYSDGSVTYPGFNFSVTSTGACFATPCAGTPPANTIVGPTSGICPGATAGLGLATSYSVGGLTFQWQASTQSSVGLWNNVPGYTNGYQTSPLTANTWYQVVVTCTNTNQSSVSGPFQVEVQGVTVNNVPYHEGFEGISAENKLPNCSWAANNLGSQAYTYKTSNNQGRVPRTGTSFASFYYNPSGSRNFYTNGIYLNAGVTYSASMWYITEYYGYNNWTNLTILAGPNQNATGQFTIAQVAPAISNVYKELSNTFTVATSGIYYVNVKANTTTSSYAYYLSWDDLSITVPCEQNQPQLTVTPSQSICSGNSININAAGVDTYTWSTGANGNSMSDMPIGNTNYTVVGTNTLTGCTASAVHQVQVFPTPQVGIFANKATLCSGQSAVLTAFGGSQYIWSNNSTSNVTTVSPLSTTAYSVYGTNVFGCQGVGVQNIIVNPSPAVDGSSDMDLVCNGSAVQLTGTGALTYQWASSSYFNQTNPAVAFPQTTTAFTVTGFDANGCSGTDFVVVSTQDCTGLNEMRTSGGVKVFPNPNAGSFTVEVAGKAQVVITDLTGRHVAAAEGTGAIDLNITQLSNGVYYVKVSTENSINVIKIVKE